MTGAVFATVADEDARKLFGCRRRHTSIPMRTELRSPGKSEAGYNLNDEDLYKRFNGNKRTIIVSDLVDVEAYLERINYHGTTIPSAETLRALQVAHLQTVPFENLSIHAGEPIVLEDEALFTKIVKRRRGGFCYECNGLFAALLRALGFDVTMLAAEVAKKDGGSEDGLSQRIKELAIHAVRLRST